MERWNSEGIRREDLVWALTQASQVRAARRADMCLLCRQGPVNEAGLCDGCSVLLNDRERQLVERWMGGVGP